MKLSQKGFTIVELLIIIVIVGILSTITATAYNGVTIRSENTANEATASNYVKLLTSYITSNGEYPTGTACLGADKDVQDGCFYFNYNQPVQQQFESRLSTVVKTLPTPQKACYKMDSFCRKGPVYIHNPAWTIDGEPHAHYMVYFLRNNASCELPGSLGGSLGSFSRAANPGGALEQYTGTSMCAIELPNPGSL